MPKIGRSPIGLRTRIIENELGEPIVISVGIFSILGRWIKGLWRFGETIRTAALTAVISTVVSVSVSYWMADKNNVTARTEANKADAGEFLCEVSAHSSDLLLCKVLVSAKDQRIAGTNDSAAGNADANKQLSLEGASKTGQ